MNTKPNRFLDLTFLTGYPDSESADQAIKFVYGNLLDVSKIQILYPLVIAFLFWGKLESWKILLWCVATICIYVARIMLALKYQRRSTDSDDPWLWGRRFTLTSMYSGLVWGYAAWLFHVPDAANELVVLYILIVGTAAGAVMISAYWMPGYLAYTVPSVSMMILSLIFSGIESEIILGGLMTLFLFMLVAVGFKARDQGYAGIMLGFENLDLVKELEVQKQNAEEANQAKTRFLASANHDLRQPVHALSLLTYAIKGELTTDRGAELYVQMDQTVQNLNGLLESLLDLSQLEAGAVKIEKQYFSLTTIAEQLRSEFLSLSADKNLQFRVRQLDEWVLTDQTLLLRLLRNLLTNALRYTASGGILLAFRKQSDHVSIEVWDTGIGIDQDQQAKIFTEFYQVDNHERAREKGLGLGLAICQRIANLMGYELGMSSRSGQGAVFKVRLPLVEKPDEQSSHAANNLVDTEQSVELANINALLVDDDLIGLSALSQVLSSFGANTTLAQTPERALEQLEENPDINFVVSDFRLSGNQDGVQLVNSIRSRAGYEAIPALIVTGDTEPAVLGHIKNSGFTYFNKPVKPENLAQAVKHHGLQGSSVASHSVQQQ